MLGLLAEYVADERLAEREDRARARFLNDLSRALGHVASLAQELPALEAIDRLRAICDSQPPEFAADTALVHLDDCIQELERIVVQSRTTG